MPLNFNTKKRLLQYNDLARRISAKLEKQAKRKSDTVEQYIIWAFKMSLEQNIALQEMSEKLDEFEIQLLKK